jgi:hypothetical protein
MKRMEEDGPTSVLIEANLEAKKCAILASDSHTVTSMIPRKKNSGQEMKAKIRSVNKTLKNTNIPPPMIWHER